MMKRTTSRAAVVAAVLALAPMQIAAQQGPRGQRGQAAGPRGAGVEMILRQREQLELTDDQVRQLDQLRREAVQRRTEHQGEMAELRSRVRAGDLEIEELRAQVEARRTAAEAIRTAQRERVQSVLNDAQKQKLEEFQRQARAFRMGRMSAMRGDRSGMRGPRQGMRSARGHNRPFRGVGPRGRRPGMGGPGMEPGPDGMGLRMGPMMDGRRGPGVGPGFGPPADTIPPA